MYRQIRNIRYLFTINIKYHMLCFNCCILSKITEHMQDFRDEQMSIKRQRLISHWSGFLSARWRLWHRLLLPSSGYSVKCHLPFSTCHMTPATIIIIASSSDYRIIICVHIQRPMRHTLTDLSCNRIQQLHNYDIRL